MFRHPQISEHLDKYPAGTVSTVLWFTVARNMSTVDVTQILHFHTNAVPPIQLSEIDSLVGDILFHRASLTL